MLLFLLLQRTSITCCNKGKKRGDALGVDALIERVMPAVGYAGR